MKFLAMHISNQKLCFDIFTVGNVQNIFMDHDALMFFLKLKSQSPFAFAVKKKKKRSPFAFYRTKIVFFLKNRVNKWWQKFNFYSCYWIIQLKKNILP